MRLPNWKFRSTEPEHEFEHEPGQDAAAPKSRDAAWPDMFANLQSAYAELTNAQFELERRTSEIAETRDLVQQIVSSMSEAMFLTDRAGRVIRANPAAAALLECSEDAILGRPISAVCGTDEIPATPWKLMELSQGGRMTNIEVEIRTAVGEVIPVSFSLSLMHDKQDKITGVLAVARDMREYRSLIAGLVSARARFQELLEYAPDAIVLANQDGEIVLINSQTERLFGYSREQLIGKSAAVLVPERLRQNGEPVDGVQPDAVLELDPAHNVHTALALRNQDEATQQLEYYCVTADGLEFPAEITQRPIVTEDGLLMMSVIRDISERKRFEVELQQSQESYRALAETASDVIITMDETRTILFVNSAVERVFGYHPDELIGRSVSLLMPPDTRLHQAERVRHYVRTGEQVTDWTRLEVTARHRHGREIPVEISNGQFVQDGRLLFTSFIRDVSLRRQAEAALRLNTRALAGSAFPVLIADAQAPDMPLTYVNAAFERVTGYAKEEVLGRNCRFLQGDDREQPGLEPLRAALREGRECTVTLRNYRKDGTLFWNELTVSPVHDEQGRVTHFVGFENDITERKRAEQSLLESTVVQRAILDFADYAIISTAPDGVITTFNHAAERLLGYPAAEMIGQQNLVLLHDPSEVANRARSLSTELGEEIPPGFEALVAGARHNLPGEGEWTYVRRDGTRLPVMLSVTALRDAAGELTGFLGIATDITARKRQEARTTQFAALRVEVTNSLNELDVSLPAMLQRCAEALVKHVDAAFARIWLVDEPGTTLVLQASAGQYTHTDGPHQFVPVGKFKIGLIAEEKRPHLTNDVLNDPRVGDRAWAERERMVAFAGYPLLVENRLLGVLALFARQPLADDTLEALASVADTVVFGVERKRAEDERRRIQARLSSYAALRIDVSNVLGEPAATIPHMLQGCAAALVKHIDAAFARLWLVDETGTTLVLQASAGLYTHTNGPHQFVPVGKFKIGLIAEEKRPHLTNDVLHDPRVGDREWAEREGMVAFAGYPLLADERLIGVMALFAKHPLTSDTLDALSSIAHTIVLGVERKRSEDERLTLLEQERESRRIAEEASRLKDDFLAMISHELRAPLTAILGWAQMLRSGTLDRASAERALTTIERNAKTQAHLVGDLLDASRIATGKLRLEMRPVELMSLIEAAVDAVRPSVEAKRLRLQMVLEPWVGPFKGDSERMKQIIWNLLSNAVKFTPGGGLIEIRLERLESKALLIVSDTGQGIDTDFLPHIFDRFRQADSSSKRSQGGLGLGLAIVKHLVELHGGAIYAYSRGIGHGSDFMITLPLTVQDAHADTGDLWSPSDETREAKGAGTLRGVRVLVVDDERDTREILSVMLARFGTEVRTAGSAAEGFELLKSWRPDLLVSDIGMPGEDGYSLLGKVRKLRPEDGGQTPAVALTAFAGSQDRQRALAAGFHVHLSKPVEPVELARVVARTLGRSERGIEM